MNWKHSVHTTNTRLVGVKDEWYDIQFGMKVKPMHDGLCRKFSFYGHVCKIDEVAMFQEGRSKGTWKACANKECPTLKP